MLELEEVVLPVRPPIRGRTSEELYLVSPGEVLILCEADTRGDLPEVEAPIGQEMVGVLMVRLLHPHRPELSPDPARALDDHDIEAGFQETQGGGHTGYAGADDGDRGKATPNGSPVGHRCPAPAVARVRG